MLRRSSCTAQNAARSVLEIFTPEQDAPRIHNAAAKSMHLCVESFQWSGCVSCRLDIRRGSKRGITHPDLSPIQIVSSHILIITTALSQQTCLPKPLRTSSSQ